MTDSVHRHTVALALIVAPAVLGSLALHRLGTDREVLVWTGGFVTLLGAVGGWIRPAAASLRPVAALAGAIMAAGALIASSVYVDWRGGDRKVRSGYELTLPLVLGGLPGLALYYAAVVRREKRAAAAQRPDAADKAR